MNGKRAKVLRKEAVKLNGKPSGYGVVKHLKDWYDKTEKEWRQYYAIQRVCHGSRQTYKQLKKAYKERNLTYVNVQ